MLQNIKETKFVTIFPGNRCPDKYSEGRKQGNQEVLLVTPRLIKYYEEVTNAIHIKNWVVDSGIHYRFGGVYVRLQL